MLEWVQSMLAMSSPYSADDSVYVYFYFGVIWLRSLCDVSRT